MNTQSKTNAIKSELRKLLLGAAVYMCGMRLKLMSLKVKATLQVQPVAKDWNVQMDVQRRNITAVSS